MNFWEQICCVLSDKMSLKLFSPIWSIYSHTMIECRVSLFLVIGQVFKKMWHFNWNFNMGVNGKPKMWHISKMATCRAKRTKIWDSGPYSAHMERTFDGRFLEFGFRSFGALCRFSNFTIFKTWHPIHPNFIQGIIIVQAVAFLAICQKLQNLWYFECFLNRTICSYNFQSAIIISPAIFTGFHPIFTGTLVTMVTLNVC